MTVEQTNGGDEDIVKLLRASLDALPQDLPAADSEPPQAVIDGAIWVHDWLNMDAELAHLAFDSTENVELAGVRSAGALRELTFEAGEYSIEITIEPGQRAVDISGTIEPPVAGKMQLVVGGEIFAESVDDSGAFFVSGVPHGTVLAFIDKTDGKIRLGSFEI